MPEAHARVLDTSAIPPRDRPDLVRHTVWSEVVKVELEHHAAPEQMRVSLDLSRAGAIGLCSVRATGTTVRRTARLARQDEPVLFLGLQVSGSSLVVQGSREAVLRPGQFAVYDTSIPYTLVNADGIDQHFFRLPLAELAVPGAALARLTAVTMGAGNPVAALTAAYLMNLATDPELRRSADADAVEDATLSLVRAALLTQLAGTATDGEALRATLAARIMAYLRAHLADPGLCAAQVAAAHHISVRYLYVVLAREGISLGDWVRTQRLEQCRTTLERSDAEQLPVATLARRWGFTDPSHFSRAFRHAYGCSATEWRRRHTGASER